jgi:hypothetical protein
VSFGGIAGMELGAHVFLYNARCIGCIRPFWHLPFPPTCLLVPVVPHTNKGTDKEVVTAPVVQCVLHLVFCGSLHKVMWSEQSCSYIARKHLIRF